MKFLLDTDTCIYALKQQRGRPTRSSREDRASGYAHRPLDTLIAAPALARELKLVSNTERGFGCVSGLDIENWARG
jgi:predicted nucleic acid-binding protein